MGNPVLITLKVGNNTLTPSVFSRAVPVYNGHKYATLGVTADISFVFICP